MPKRVVAVLILFLALAGMSSSQSADLRIRALAQFLGERPAQRYALEFLRAADHYRLDWRLLPCLTLVETAGGKNASNFNIFGWDAGRARFESTAQAIHKVAERLALAAPYRHKPVEEKLRTYNQVDVLYPFKVLNLMDQLGRLHHNLQTLEAARHCQSSAKGGC